MTLELHAPSTDAGDAPPLAFARGAFHPFVERLVGDRAAQPGDPRTSVERAIAEEDEMLQFAIAAHDGNRDRALASYFDAGASVLDSLRQLVRWKFGGFAGAGDVLDFAAGFGRVTRFMVRELPPERLWVADIYPRALAFQRRTFGVHTLASAHAAAAFQPGRAFDVIFVSSLFTHLPLTAFKAWLERLVSLLRPQGMLVFSVHDAAVLPPGCEMPESGFLFARTSESRTLDTSEYGSTWVTERRTGELIGECARGLAWTRLPRGLCNFQDLYVVVRGPADFSTLAFDPGPEGFLEVCAVENGDLVLSGWALDRAPGRSVASVQVHLDGVPLGETRPQWPRPDVAAHWGDERFASSGWSLRIAMPAGLPGSTGVLGVRLVSDAGIGRYLHFGTLEGALLEAHILDLRAARTVVARADGEIAGWRQRLDATERHNAELAMQARTLEARVAAMSASRFWLLRERWFAVKRMLGRMLGRTLGLTQEV